MALIDEARAALAGKGPSCTAGIFLARLDAEQRAEVDEALSDESVTFAAVTAALEARAMTQGWPKPPKTQTITRHIRGRCSCG